MIEESLKTHLEGYAGLTALVSARVYPRRIPQAATLPAVSYLVYAGETKYRHRGSTGKAETFMQIDAWASTYAAAKAVAEEVRKAMNTFTGTISGLAVHYAEKISVQDLIDPEPDIHHIAQDFRVLHAETP